MRVVLFSVLSALAFWVGLSLHYVSKTEHPPSTDFAVGDYKSPTAFLKGMPDPSAGAGFAARKSSLAALFNLPVPTPEETALKLCAREPSLCHFGLKAASLVRDHFQDSVVRIAYHESGGFKHSVGIANPDDKCYMMINEPVWRLHLGEKVWKKILRNDLKTCIEEGAYIWLYNLALHLKVKKRLPPSREARESLYHRPFTVVKYYYKKMRALEL